MPPCADRAVGSRTAPAQRDRIPLAVHCGGRAKVLGGLARAPLLVQQNYFIACGLRMARCLVVIARRERALCSACCISAGVVADLLLSIRSVDAYLSNVDQYGRCITLTLRNRHATRIDM